ncbi:hypothetical protein LCGC14_1851390 [marine sediment metagenome]|uniref:Uncharacterized protein n=1 Tax=marine sediment metagenome TaxID=412755 RepID=A0A0F9GAN0_9ZZZZ
MEAYTLETVNIKDEKTDKRGKKYHSVGVRIAGGWFNNIIYNYLKNNYLCLKDLLLKILMLGDDY